ncbi:MAG: histidine phosphatase family protein [Bacillota bacterium]
MTTIYFVRHGETHYDLAEQRRLKGGMRDLVPLTDKGREQALSAAERLRGMPITRIVTSPMTRAMETAHIIAVALGLPMAVEFDLHEWLPDLSHNYDSSRFAREQSAEMECLGGEWPTGETRGWEPLSSVRQRVRSSLIKYQGGEPLVVVAHGTLIYAMTGERISTGHVIKFEL